MRTAGRMAFVCLLALACFAGTALAQEEPAAAPSTPATPPELVDAFIGYEKLGDSDVWLDGHRWYHRNALKIVDGRVSLFKSPAWCDEGTLRYSESDGGFYWYEGTVEPTKETGGRDFAVLTLASCDHCGRAMIPRPEPVKLTQPISHPTPDTIRLGDVTYDRRIAPDATACPAITTQDDAAQAESPSEPRTE